MSNWDWDTIVWGGWLALFLLLELTAVFGLVPWTSLSGFCWKLETFSDAIKFVFLIGLAVLLVHIVAHWPA